MDETPAWNRAEVMVLRACDELKVVVELSEEAAALGEVRDDSAQLEKIKVSGSS